MFNVYIIDSAEVPHGEDADIEREALQDCAQLNLVRLYNESEFDPYAASTEAIILWHYLQIGRGLLSRIPRWRRMLFGRTSDTNFRGFVLVCDASPFVRANDAQRTAAFARTLSDRLRAGASVLRREFPVYVLFSKCDGVQYFSEFFSHLSELFQELVLKC